MLLPLPQAHAAIVALATTLIVALAIRENGWVCDLRKGKEKWRWVYGVSQVLLLKCVELPMSFFA
jgi:hypothetical protein